VVDLLVSLVVGPASGESLGSIGACRRQSSPTTGYCR